MLLCRNTHPPSHTHAHTHLSQQLHLSSPVTRIGGRSQDVRQHHPPARRIALRGACKVVRQRCRKLPPAQVAGQIVYGADPQGVRLGIFEAGGCQVALTRRHHRGHLMLFGGREGWCLVWGREYLIESVAPNASRHSLLISAQQTTQTNRPNQCARTCIASAALYTASTLAGPSSMLLAYRAPTIRSSRLCCGCVVVVREWCRVGECFDSVW